MKSILITGANGFICKNLVPIIEEKYKDYIIFKVGKSDYD